MHAAWSIHDVSPATIGWAQTMVERLCARGISLVTILIIPYGDWPEAAIESLRGWQANGHVLALHGWDHRSVTPSSVYQRVHSAVFSRDAAEHLGRSRAELLERVQRGRDWFAANGLGEPDVYVPPAWALGAIRPKDLGAMGFRWVETLTGIEDTTRRVRHLLPLAGFQADTLARAVSLRASNAINAGLARVSGRPIRVAVHPYDDSQLLSGDLEGWIRRGRPGILPAELIR